jgi:hypothetical protein
MELVLLADWILVSNVGGGLKSPPQFVEALRADG